MVSYVTNAIGQAHAAVAPINPCPPLEKTAFGSRFALISFRTQE